MTRSRVVRVRTTGVGHVTQRDAERVRDETSGIGPGSSGRKDGVGTGRGTSHNTPHRYYQRFALVFLPASHITVVLGKFGPRPIGTRSGPDQTLRSRSRSGIFPKIPDRSVSGLGILKLRETVSDPVWTRTA